MNVASVQSFVILRSAYKYSLYALHALLQQGQTRLVSIYASKVHALLALIVTLLLQLLAQQFLCIDASLG